MQKCSGAGTREKAFPTFPEKGCITHISTFSKINEKGHRVSLFDGLLIAEKTLISTRCSATAERPRCRVRYSFGQKWKTRTGRQYFTDII